MPRTAEALVKRELLRWARDESGLTVEAAARKAKASPERLESWEEGKARPTVAQLRKLAKAYRRPLAVFYLPEPPAPLPTPRDFRRPPTALPLSPELRLAHREAVHRREIALELLREIGEPPPRFTLSATTDDEPEQIGARLRGELGITHGQQIHWRSTGYARRAWGEACENAGVLVCQARNVKPEEMSGFSIADFPLPVVVVNIKDAEERRIFTLVHEMVHIATKQGGLCYLDHSLAGPAQRVEAFCNRVAGAALVPLEDLCTERVVREGAGSSGWSDDDIKALARRFRVSREVVLLRMVAGGLASREFYEQKREQIRREYRRRESKRTTGGPAPPSLAIAKAGRLFAGLVLRAYHLERITASDVADHLEVRVKHISDVENALFGPARIGPT